MKTIALLGSTGSIGVNVCNVVRQFPEKYGISALAAGTNVEVMAAQCREFNPELASVANEEYAEKLKALLPGDCPTEIVYGEQGNIRVATHAEASLTVSAIVGAAGLLPTLAAIEAGKDVGLANKETLVMAGRLVMEAVEKQGVQLLPIDSEHSAIFQALEGGQKADLAKIILTASGGPFRLKSSEELQKVTKEEALDHPNWSMGRKISIDSATLMNKGLEVIEAKWLFEVSADTIEVVVHPQSIVHSLVEYQDGSILAQLGIPDMRVPIAYALSYPERLPLQLKRLRLSECARLEFMEPDLLRFPALGLAFDALHHGGVLPAVLNAANEVAVAAFLDDLIRFPSIAGVVDQTMKRVHQGSDRVLADILQADADARRVANELVKSDFRVSG